MSNVNATGCPTSEGHPDLYPSGLTYGAQLDGYKGTLLDFAYGELGAKAVAAHVSCCDFPSPEALPELWMQNLPPLTAFLRAASMGVYGRVTDLSGRPLTKTRIVLDGRGEIRVNDKDASFAAVLAPGPHTLSLSLEDYEAKTVRVNIAEDMDGKGRVRKNVVLDSLFGEKIAFRSAKAIDAYVDELARNYSGLARAYDVGASHGRKMKALEVSTDLGKSHMKPGIRIMAGFRGRESVGSQV